MNNQQFAASQYPDGKYSHRNYLLPQAISILPISVLAISATSPTMHCTKKYRISFCNLIDSIQLQCNSNHSFVQCFYCMVTTTQSCSRNLSLKIALENADMSFFIDTVPFWCQFNSILTPAETRFLNSNKNDATTGSWLQTDSCRSFQFLSPSAGDAARRLHDEIVRSHHHPLMHSWAASTSPLQHVILDTPSSSPPSPALLAAPTSIATQSCITEWVVFNIHINTL